MISYVPVNPAIIKPKLIGKEAQTGHNLVSIGSIKLPGFSCLINPSITITNTKEIALNIPSNEKYERDFMEINVNGVIIIHAIILKYIIDILGNIVCKESPNRMTSAVDDAINSNENNIEIAIRAFSPNATAPINKYEEKKNFFVNLQRNFYAYIYSYIPISAYV
jgi:hypothetical protein